MIVTQAEQTRVFEAVEAVLKAQIGAHPAPQQGQESQATPTGAGTFSSARDATSCEPLGVSC
jgi:hypothetical protein